MEHTIETGENRKQMLELQASRLIHRQIAAINAAKDLRAAIQAALAEIGEFLGADRAFIFERDDDHYDNTYEWCAPDVRAEIDTLQGIPQNELRHWTDVLEQSRCVVIPDVEAIRTEDPFVYETLVRQDITSVVEAPIAHDNHLRGFIGVDNAQNELTELIADSLTVLGTFIGTAFRNQEEHERLKESHENIRNNHNMQQEIVGAISCGVMAYTVPDRHMLTINEEAKRIIGCRNDDTAETILWRFFHENVHPDDREAMRNLQVRQPGDSQRFFFRAVKDGEMIHVKSNVKMLEFTDGTRYILCTMLDITEQVRLADSLAKERKSYRDALATNSEFTFFFDVTDGVILEEFVTAHQVNLVQQMGLTVPCSFDLLLEKYRKQCSIRFASPDMEAYFTSAGLLDAFNRGITNAMTEFYNPITKMHLRTSCLMSRDDSSGHIHASVVATNITEIRNQEMAQKTALQEANRKLALANDEMNTRVDAILNGISGGLKIIDIEDGYRYTYISEGAAALQGYTVEEFLQKFGRRVTNNIHPEDGEKALATASALMQQQGHYAVKYRVPHKDGGIRWVIDRGKLVKDNVTGKDLWYILMQDVTELQDRNIELSNVLAMQKEMAESLGSGILAYTVPQREVLLLNREAQEMFGWNSNDTQTFRLMREVVPEDQQMVRDVVKQLKKPGDQVDYVFHYITDKGMNAAFSCRTKLLEFEDGQRYILSSLNDITEQEQMEKRLDQERLQYRNALAFGSELFFTIDPHQDIIQEHIISKSGKNLTEALGLSMPARYDDLAAAWFNPDRIIASPEVEDALEMLRNRSRIIECCRESSRIIDFEYHIPSENKYYHVMVLLDAIAGNTRASFILYDITADRKEEQQRRSVIDALNTTFFGVSYFSLRENSYIAFQQSPDLQAIMPERGRLDDFIDAYLDNLVLPEFREEMTGFLSPDAMRRNLADAEFTSIEFRRLHLGWCRVTLVVAERDEFGNPTAVVFAGNVIEAQKQAELSRQEALRAAYESANIANSAKTDFLANMSHDIRTPMNAIIGMTAIAGTHLEDKERVADCLSKITVASKHLLGLINEVLDMSKIESGKMELQEEEFNLPELVDNLLTMSKSDIASRNHALTVNIRSIEHENVIGDSQRIQQVFMNIMSNAIKYTPEGGEVELTISEKPTNRPKIGCYEFIFKDNGIGMSEESLQNLFEPFVRAQDDARVDKIQGTGLGMPITRNIIQMMNGDIKVDSKLNEGTTVNITFFLRLVSEDEQFDVEKLIDLPVLVIDDDESACEYACTLLDELGMKSEYVCSGMEGVARTLQEHENGKDFFAVIIDWKMPELDGVETTRRIRQQVGKDVTIIIISAFDWSEIEPEARAAGANAFISKPMFKSRMIHLFHELVEGEQHEAKLNALDDIASADFGGRRVLLVEDNELNAEIAGEILEMAGLTVEYAVNGKEAVDMMAAAEDGRYGLVFMDIQMPVMNGYEAARAIRELEGDYPKSVPIIAMTANAFAEDVAAARGAGMNEHIPKPLDFDRLIQTLRRWL